MKTEKLLINYDWPGNVRELKNVMERAAILCQSDIIDAEHLPIELRTTSPKEHKTIPLPPPSMMPYLYKILSANILSTPCKNLMGINPKRHGC